MFPRSPLPYYMRYDVLLALCYLAFLTPKDVRTYNQERNGYNQTAHLKKMLRGRLAHLWCSLNIGPATRDLEVH